MPANSTFSAELWGLDSRGFAPARPRRAHSFASSGRAPCYFGSLMIRQIAPQFFTTEMACDPRVLQRPTWLPLCRHLE